MSNYTLDIPSIISGNYVAFLEPQEQIWQEQSGRWFLLEELAGSDHLSALHGIADFNSRNKKQYNKTIFRFPLRSVASSLSENLYTVDKVKQLIDALRSEAKLLLLFLRSIHTIEVYNIDIHGAHTLTFQTKTVGDDIQQKQGSLLRDLKRCHASQPYQISRVIQFTAKFDVCVYDANTRQTSRSHWLVANQVGSTNATVRAASVKQKVFPWVGTAVEVGNPGNGRIFTVLPMPIETASNLPVHVNGTFGLSDDRRSLKWPGVERRNDPMADWNGILVKDVIPSCYVSLLLAYKRNGCSDFYSVWPLVSSLGFHWKPLLLPLFNSIFKEKVIRLTANTWEVPDLAVYVPKDTTVPGVVRTTLGKCGVKLAEIPPSVWDAFSYMKKNVPKVEPRFVRGKLRSSPNSYADIGVQDKKELLSYCLSDGEFTDLVDLRLLPMANGSFAAFSRPSSAAMIVYMCTKEFPRELLPNLSHKLVDLTSEYNLNMQLELVAVGNWTQLKLLNVDAMAKLINEALSILKDRNVVTFPNHSFPSEWFPKFWEWVANKQLRIFSNQLVFPIHVSIRIPASQQFRVVKLSTTQPVLYFPSRTDNKLLSLLDKLSIQYCTQTSFPFVRNNRLTDYVKLWSPETLLDMIVMGERDYSSISFTPEEVKVLKKNLSEVKAEHVPTQKRVVLNSLRIFTTCANTSGRLYSINEACQTSLLRKVVLKPKDTIDESILPANVVLFSSDSGGYNYHQNLLLTQTLGYQESNGADFLIEHIFPNILSMGERCTDEIMTRVLAMYPTLRYKSSIITNEIQNLQFVKVAAGGRKRPSELYDPSNDLINQIFFEEGVFPCHPYNKYIENLSLCGLRSSVSPQEILDVIYSISLPANSHPQEVNKTKLTRTKAVMKYISSKDFSCQVAGTYQINRSIQKGYMPFPTALLLLSCYRSWLPVLSERPCNYPARLPWKGTEYQSHFASLSDSVCVSSSSRPSHPLLYGSQAVFTEQFDSVESDEPKGCLVAHFRQVIACKDRLSPKEMSNIVDLIYSAIFRMAQTCSDVHHLKALKSMEEWVYIKKEHTFVSVSSMALRQNPGFRHNMEPYLYLLPDSISEYSQLFVAFGVNETISETQIVSILNIIREQVNANPNSVSCKDAWGTVMAILNWLTENGTKTIDSDSLYVPAESDSKWPDLRDTWELVYTDNEYLKSFVSSSSNNEPLTFVHSCINKSLAESLQITPLSEELDISEDTFEDAGQSEPLIVRLKNILRDYKDGLTIIKELIQNADDAGATEVDICFDARNHKAEQGRLFFPDMCESHGPALVIHNNSTFRDEDFENIQKLAGATKQHSKHLKIGKFGIGFCSVYHITDVPSFVSRDRLFIFDPTLKHLGKAVKNPAQPGKKVKYLSKVIQQSKQMEPYKGLFGFTGDTEYKGTLFRLPFRTTASELSNTCYSKSDSTVKELLDSIRACGDGLLLFLQNVRRITVQRFSQGDSSPKVHFVLTKSIYKFNPSPANTSVVKVVSESAGGKEESNWLVTQQRTTHETKPAVANVACTLTLTNASNYTVNKNLKGEIFCFLPLSQYTGLPVHVSCNFAVINNRRGIWTSQESGSVQDVEVQWNIFLMKKVIPLAYIELLRSLKTMFASGVLQDYKFHSMWPLSSQLQQKNPWDLFVETLYSALGMEVNKLFYSEPTSSWLSHEESKFLDPNILGSHGYLACVVEVIHHLKIPLVNLPVAYRSQFRCTRERLTEKEFIDLYFSSIHQLQPISNSRDEVICCMLETFVSQLDKKSALCQHIGQKLHHCPCIPSRHDGSVLKKCSELVDPRAVFAGLFEASDHRFPMDLLLTKSLAMTALQHAGMMHATLPWELVINRAQSVRDLIDTDPVKALERVMLILATIGSYVKGDPPSSGVTIDSVDFLPVVRKPHDYPLDWYGDNFQLLPGKHLVLSRDSLADFHARIAGSQVAFLCENSPKMGGCGGQANNIRAVKKLLCLKSSPSLMAVVSHLKAVIDRFDSSSPPEMEWVSKTCQDIYLFIEQNLSDSEECLSELRKIACIWNGRQFLSIDSVALHWKMSEGPYLYTAPPSVAKKELSSALGIKKHFTCQDAINALNRMKSDFKNNPIDVPSTNLVTELVSIFITFKNQHPEKLVGTIHLPDTEGILRKSSDLVYNDAHWAPLDDSRLQVSKIFSRDLALSLGVQPERSKMLEQYVSKKQALRGIPFGQREELTLRIQNIIRDYPFDITVLKELLQNADDAKAKKMHIILDKRTHGRSSVISEEWQKLQGPALLVWNDSVFSEKDLKGIQELGMGSKRSEAETIGQYGIGFNVVYHLTDCPSFVTKGDTLCVMDPHCKYVPEAEELFPGARYDNLKNGFWRTFPDMSSAYLQNERSESLPDEFHDGSLFRLPIRHTDQMVKSSKIVDTNDSGASKPLSAEKLSELLCEWMPQMKEAMFFLNNMTEIKYMEIEQCLEAGEMVEDLHIQTKFHFRTKISKSPAFDSSFKALQDSIAAFTETSNCRSQVMLYPMTVSEMVLSEDEKEKTHEEKWLIQQGVGDIYDEGQVWQYVKRIKPRHGIAAPLKRDMKRSGGMKRSRGKLFCFLPLPIPSGVPVHINGCFVLDSNRRSLWKSTTKDNQDDRSRWNECLFKAVASSYANFLVQARSIFLKSTYKNREEALHDLTNYYHLFPTFQVTDRDKQWDSLPCKVFRILAQSNAEVLCVLVSEQQPDGRKISIEWHPLHSAKPSDQVYFTTSSQQNDIRLVLESIGMKITSAPSDRMDCFNHTIEKLNSVRVSNSVYYVIEHKIPHITPNTVFSYYTQHSQFSSQGMHPCMIETTIFKDAETFLLFTKYLIGALSEACKKDGTVKNAPATTFSIAIPQNFNFSSLPPSTDELELEPRSYPESPFTHFLLLSADGMLRAFDEKNKVLNSKHSGLFPDHLDMFLHPVLKTCCYNMSYFVTPEDKDSDEVTEQVLGIINGTFPCDLYGASSVLNASSIVNKDQLSSCWKCFEEDKVISSFVPAILKQWALLLTVDDRLFSTSSTVLPIHLVPSEHETFQQVCDVMRSLQMPFLDSAVIAAEVNYCPKLSESSRILENLYYTNANTLLTSVLDNTQVDTLIRYFSPSATPGDTKWVEQISSLPFFEDVLGTYLPIVSKKAYIWPWACSSTAYRCWATDENVFVKARGTWTKLGSREQLSISTPSAERVYEFHIFPKFDCLKESDRYSHLEHIVEGIFTENFYNSEKKTKNKSERVREKIYEGRSFIRAFRQLQCIGPDNSQLQPINAFYDDTVNKVFSVFARDFQTLPDPLKSDKLLPSFRQLGLQTTVSQDQFLNLCRKVAAEKVEDVQTSSDTLFNYLYSSFRNTDERFLKEVSKIAFVRAYSTSSVKWIVPGACHANKLVKLEGAASTALLKCVWTVQPVVELPAVEQHQYHAHISHPDITSLLKISKVAEVPNVVANVMNICKSSYADESLFVNYPDSLLSPKTSADDMNLQNVMLHNLEFLNKCEDHFEVSKLAESPCIPVYCDLCDQDKGKMVLVKPSSVISYCKEIGKYHPYLHCIPPEFNGLAWLLKTLNIRPTLELSHMQIILAKIFALTNGTKLDPNAKECVRSVLNGCKSLISSDVKAASALTLLYLPDTSDELKPSTQMLYGDTLNYSLSGIQLDLSNTPYSHFDIGNETYGVSAFDFCHLLPPLVRPLGMSEMCKMVHLESCKSVGHSAFSLRVQQALKHESNSMTVAKVCRTFVPTSTSESDFMLTIESFFSSLKVVTKDDLNTNIVLKESGIVIGCMKSDFYLESEGCPQVLYIDQDFEDEDDIITEITEHLYSKITKLYFPGVSLDYQTKLIISKYLKATTPAKKLAILSKYNFNIRNQCRADFVLELGEEIPELFYHRLDQDPYNIFSPMEYVGYEGRDGHIKVAQVSHLVNSGDGNHLTKIYYIFTGKEDSKGREVSILDLYKFLMRPKARVTDDKEEPSREDLSVVLYSEEIDTSNLRKSLFDCDVAEIKKSILKELKEIWKLDKKLRDKAVRRLYLKWHPDKNLDNVVKATEIFLFLKKQISLLERGAPLGSSEAEGTRYAPPKSKGSSRDDYEFPYHKWDNWANAQRKSHEQDAMGDPGPEFPRDEGNPEEGWRWLKQAEIDYGVLCDMYSKASANSGYAHVCFMAHQVAEKALKGGVNALCGEDGRVFCGHKLAMHALALQTVKPDQTHGLSDHCMPLEDFYSKTRYPDHWPGYTDTPSDHYDDADADQAKKHAKAVLDIVMAIMPQEQN